MPKMYSVLAGKHNVLITEDGEQRRQVSAIRTHENYGGNNWIIDYDIAVMKLEEPIFFSETVQPIALPDRESPISVSTKCKFAG